VLTLPLYKRYVAKLESFVLISCLPLVIQFKDTFVEYFSPHQFGVTMFGGCKTMVHGVKATLNLHPKWVVLHVDVWNTFNLVSRTTIFQELRSFIDFSHLFVDFMHAHFHYIFRKLYLSMGISLSFHPSLIHNMGSFGRNVVWTSSFSNSLSYYNNPLYLCFFFIGKWYAHSWSCFTCVTFFYDYKRSLLQIFSVADKVCHLVFTRFRLIYITSSKFSYT